MLPEKPLRIIQGYTGDIAQHQIRLLAECPWAELVGAYVHHDAKHGRDAGEIAGIRPLGVRATTDLDEILALDADAVLYNPPMERYDEVIRMLASGKNVVSIMAGWNPKKRSCFPEILEACEKGQSSIYGTGLNPGLSYELALLASSICSEVESISIKTCEPQDTLGEVFLTMFGFGKTEAELAEGPSGVYAIFAGTLHQITDLLCEELQLPHDGNAFEYEFEPATRDYDEKILVRKGTMGGCCSARRRRPAGARSRPSSCASSWAPTTCAKPGSRAGRARDGSRWTCAAPRGAASPTRSPWTTT